LTAVAIIGAGPLGRSLALRCARAGFQVFLEDLMPANLQHARESIVRELGPEDLPGVAFVSSIEDAVRQADLVIDCVPDELESKLEILWLIDRMAPPRTVIATPTLNLSIADLAGCTNRPEKCLAIAAPLANLTSGASPALLLRAAPTTSEETVSLVTDFFRELGLQPTVERVSA
jgi:3-hydroxybutyryl-CoA dehydrogenase